MLSFFLALKNKVEVSTLAKVQHLSKHACVFSDYDCVSLMLNEILPQGCTGKSEALAYRQ